MQVYRDMELCSSGVEGRAGSRQRETALARARERDVFHFLCALLDSAHPTRSADTFFVWIIDIL